MSTFNRTKMGAGDGKQKREILGTPPFGAPPFGPPLGLERVVWRIHTNNKHTNTNTNTHTNHNHNHNHKNVLVQSGWVGKVGHDRSGEGVLCCFGGGGREGGTGEGSCFVVFFGARRGGYNASAGPAPLPPLLPSSPLLPHFPGDLVAGSLHGGRGCAGRPLSPRFNKSVLDFGPSRFWALKP